MPEFTTGVATVWTVTLLVVVLVIVPVAVSLLRRALRAARNIEGYFSDMKDAGVLIAGHTAAIPALDRTIETAVAMKPVADSINDKSAIVATLLAERAEGVARP